MTEDTTTILTGKNFLKFYDIEGTRYVVPGDINKALNRFSLSMDIPTWERNKHKITHKVSYRVENKSVLVWKTNLPAQ